MTGIPITHLGAAGALVLCVLWLVFRFLEKRRNGYPAAMMTDKIIVILEYQTKILDRITNRQDDIHNTVSEIQLHVRGDSKNVC